jgi:hypothetical protein
MKADQNVEYKYPGQLEGYNVPFRVGFTKGSVVSVPQALTSSLAKIRSFLSNWIIIQSVYGCLCILGVEEAVAENGDCICTWAKERTRLRNI